MIGELDLEERAAIDHGRVVLEQLGEALYAAGRPNAGDEASVSAGVLRRLLARDLQPATG